MVIVFPGFTFQLHTLKEHAVFQAQGYSLLSGTSSLAVVSKIWGRGMEEIKKKKIKKYFLAVYCNHGVLLLPTSTAGGALDPSRQKLYLVSSSKVRIMPSNTSLLVLALTG